MKYQQSPHTTKPNRVKFNNNNLHQNEFESRDVGSSNRNDSFDGVKSPNDESPYMNLGRADTAHTSNLHSVLKKKDLLEDINFSKQTLKIPKN